MVNNGITGSISSDNVIKASLSTTMQITATLTTIGAITAEINLPKNEAYYEVSNEKGTTIIIG